jgi:hypothetical protein
LEKSFANTQAKCKPSEPSQSDGFRISNWKSFEKNALRGFFDVTLPSGMVLRRCSLFEKGEARWIGLPSTKFVKRDGTAEYTPCVEFVDRETASKFRDHVIAALDMAVVSK